MAREVIFKVFRGDEHGGEMREYEVPVTEGMVVLDAIHYIQEEIDPDLAVRWNCKAAKCGSCSAEVNGMPRLTCKTRLDDLDLSEPVVVEPLRSFPIVRDLVTDVSWNFEVNKMITPFTPHPDADWVFYQPDVERSRDCRKCIECFLCQDVCHVLREHDKKDQFMGPRFFVRIASLEMHPLDAADRLAYLKGQGGISLCNVTKCCTEVCPEEIRITDDAIIPLKERVIDEYYDPVLRLLRRLFGGKKVVPPTRSGARGESCGCCSSLDATSRKRNR